MYPRPGLVIVTLTILPSIIVGCNVAVCILATGTNLNRFSLAIFVSYTKSNLLGCGSIFCKVLKLKSSTIRFLANTLFALSIICFRASILLTNIL